MDDNSQVQTISQQAAAAPPEGKRARRAFMMKQFLPGDAQAWIAANVVAKGKGSIARVGRVFGICTSAEEKFNDINGVQTRSITLFGVISTENYLTGEVGEATTVYLPLAFSEKVLTAFKRDPHLRAVEFDCDIGLEATGKTIPYEWVVISYVDGAEMAALSRLRARRARPEGASDKLPSYAIEASSAQAMLEGPEAGATVTTDGPSAETGDGDLTEGQAELVSEVDESPAAGKGKGGKGA